MNGDCAVIGIPGDNDNGTDSGSALVFENISTIWVQANKLLANDGEAGDNFGTTVDYFAGRWSIGVNLDDSEFGIDSGAAFIFQNDTIFINGFE